MDQKTIQAGGILSGVIVIFCGVLVSPIAIGLAWSYPHELWWLGAILCICCFLMIAGGIQTIRSARQKERMSKQELARIETELALQKATEALANSGVIPTNVPAAVPLRPEVLAHWTFTSEEWNQFIALEKRRRLEGAFFEALGIVILGTIVIILAREAVFSIALLVSTVIALIIGTLRYVLNMRSYGHTLRENEVTITTQSIRINDKLNPYRSDTFRLDKLEFKSGSPDVLEFTYAWQNRKKKKVSDEIRIPIPKGKSDEARILIEKIINSTR